MPAPTNTSWATATDLGSLTASGSQTVDDAGTTYTVYFTWTADVARLVGAWFFGDLTTYKPTTKVYTVSGGVATAYPSNAQITGQNVPLQLQVTAGVTYGFEVIPNGNPSPATLTWDVQSAPMATIPSGSLLVNDDTSGFPGVTVDAGTGLVNGYGAGMVAGEAGDVLSDGSVIALEDNVSSPASVALYNSSLVLQTSVSPFASATALRLRRVFGASAFYVGWAGSGGTFAQARRVAGDGSLGGTTYTLAAIGLTAIAVDSAESVIYYSGSGGSLNSNIKRWNIGSNSAGTDLVADFGGTYFVSDMLMLGDDTLLVMYAQSSPNDVTIKRYDVSTGAVLNTYALGSEDHTTSPKLATATDDPTSFWAWTHNTDGTSKFRHITVSDGTVQATLTVQEFEEGTYRSTANATPTRFGISQSCPFVVLRSEIAVSTGTIVVTKDAGTDTSTDFSFSTVGLSPSTFTLKGGASRSFTGLAPGNGYGVVEVAQDGWDLRSAVVSTGDPLNKITVTAGATTTVTFTNAVCDTGVVEAACWSGDTIPENAPAINQGQTQPAQGASWSGSFSLTDLEVGLKDGDAQ